jgi:hypothetical protein
MLRFFSGAFAAGVLKNEEEGAKTPKPSLAVVKSSVWSSECRLQSIHNPHPRTKYVCGWKRRAGKSCWSHQMPKICKNPTSEELEQLASNGEVRAIFDIADV